MDAKNIKNQQSPETHESKLSIKSIGYAAHNLDLDSNLLEILPTEELGYVDGEITDDRETTIEGGVDYQGNAYMDSVETSNSMVAEWLQWGSNRHSPPNIRRGERVLIWQYSDQDKYYWTAMGMDDHLRRRESIVVKLSNTTDESTKKIDSSNSYSLIMSTHTKEVTLQTTDTDGEKFTYIIKLDTKKGIFVISDNQDNQISLESEDNKITLTNGSGSSISLDKKNIVIEAADTIKLKGKIVTIDSSVHNINATTHNINADTTGYNSGKYVLKGQVEIQGKIVNNGVNIGATHTHGGVESGPSRTSTPR